MQDAIFTTATDEKGKSLTIPLPRHPLMVGIEKSYLKELQEEADLDRELGLTNQVHMDEMDVLRRDINELTSSKDFVEVSDSDVEGIFNVPWLRFKCSLNTALSIAKMLIVEMILLAIGTTLLVINDGRPIAALIAPAVCAFVAVLVMVVVKACSTPSLYKWTSLEVNMNRERLQETRVRLPKGAKLKVKEAKDTGVFAGFDIVHPSIGAEDHRLELPKMSYDPAILGITPDRRQFLIVCWDVENDEVKTSPKRLMALKLKHAMKTSRMFR